MPYENAAELCPVCATTIWGFGNTKQKAKDDLEDKMKTHKKQEHGLG